MTIIFTDALEFSTSKSKLNPAAQIDNYPLAAGTCTKDIAQITIAPASSSPSSSSSSPTKLTPDELDQVQDLLAVAAKHLPTALGRLRDQIFVKAEGCYVWDENGRQILDFTCGLGVTNLGHCHPAVTSAVIAQSGTVTHIQPSLALSLPQLKLVQALVGLLPPPLDGFFFANSGTEASEAAIKMVKRVTGRSNIVVMQTGFHGRTYGACSLTTSELIYNQHCGPTMGGLYTVPFPYWHLLGLPATTPEAEIVKRAIFQLDLLFKTVTHPKDVAAIFIEPVLGHGGVLPDHSKPRRTRSHTSGYIPCPPAYLHHLRSLCTAHGILLVVDEVQSGFGRTGKLFAFQRCVGDPDQGIPDFVPDVVTFGKGCANGYPLSGMVANKAVMDKMDPGSLGGTLAGNAVSCAASLATLQHLTPDLYSNVFARSHQLLNALKQLASVGSPMHHLIVDVRGLGLMVGIEFRSGDDPLTLSDGDSERDGMGDGSVQVKVPKGIGKRVREKCWERGLMVLTTSCFDSIRLIPALIVTSEQMELAIKVIIEALFEIAKEG